MKGLLSTINAAALYGKDRRTFERRVEALHVEVHLIHGRRGFKKFYRTADVEWMKKQAA